MAIKKVRLEKDCTVCGLCEDICPEVFKVNDEAVVIEGANSSGYEEKTMEAAESCLQYFSSIKLFQYGASLPRS
jgi:ferredoxin